MGSGGLGRGRLTGFAKDGKVVRLSEAVLLPLPWPSEGTVDRPVALGHVDSVGGWERGGVTQGLSWEQRKLRSSFLSSAQSPVETRGGTEQAATFVCLLSPCLYLPTGRRPGSARTWVYMAPR